MLFREDPCGEGGFGIVVLDDDGCLRDDGSVIHLFVDKMNGDPGDLVAVVESLLLRVQSLEGGEECGVDVHDAVGERAEQSSGHDTIEAGQSDRIGTGVAQVCDHGIFKGFAVGIIAMRNDNAGDSGYRGMLETFGLLAIAEHRHDLGLKMTRLSRFDDGTQIRSATRYEYAEFHKDLWRNLCSLRGLRPELPFPPSHQ